jgi:OPA family sugar phosphate sensor protein UhpC-like MFS transporter
VKALWNWFKPASHAEELQDPEQINSSYRYWRIRIMYSMFIGYALYYFTRKSFTFAMPGLIEDLHFDKAQLGLLNSVLFITYGISKFGSGILSDKSSPRVFMAFGLIMTGIFNVLFGFSSSIFLFALFWGFNGWFQGFGWPPCARFLTHWYSQSERGSWWSIWNVSQNVGAALIPWFVGLCMYYFSWRFALYLPGVISIFGGIFLLNRLRDTPRSVGLPTIEDFRNDFGDKTFNNKSESNISAKQILWDCVLTNKYMWLLGIAAFFIYVVRIGVSDWTVLYLYEHKGYNRIVSSGCISLFEVGGFLGSLCAGWASDHLFGAKRGPVNVLFATSMLAATFLLWSVPKGLPLVDACALFLLGFSTFGPQMLIGMAAAELAPKEAASTSTGFVGLWAYLGAACAGLPIGKIAQEFGWHGFFYAMIACCAISILVLLPMWGLQKKKLPIQTSA